MEFVYENKYANTNYIIMDTFTMTPSPTPSITLQMNISVTIKSR